jgi:flagellar basal-body rod protein FlgB
MHPIDITTHAVSVALDMAQRRAEIASHNIAYANVPGAQMSRADFSSALSVLGRVADDAPVSATDLGEVNLEATHSVRNGGVNGTVSLDGEVTELALANCQYQALSEAMNRQFGLMNLALSGDQG